jgi:hypothetical protein
MEESKMNTKGVPFLGRQYITRRPNDEEVIEGFDINLLYKGTSHLNYNGLDITGFIRNIAGDSKGIAITGLVNLVGGDTKGLSLTGVYNYSANVNNWSIQYGTLGNVIENTSDDSFILQVGLCNRIENRYSPIINVKGLKNILNIFRRVK